MDGQRDLSESHSVMSNSLWRILHGLYSPWDFLGQNTGVGSCSLLQGIFPTQGSNPNLPHCRQILYQLELPGKPRIMEWVAYPFFRGSFWPRNWTRVSCIAGGFFTSWDTKHSHWGLERYQEHSFVVADSSSAFPTLMYTSWKRSIDSNNFWISNPVSMSLGFTTSRSWWILNI